MSHSAPGVRCVLGFTFMADHYAGIIRLQDALFKEKLLYRMPTEAEYLTTSDGKRKFLLLCNVYLYSLSKDVVFRIRYWEGFSLVGIQFIKIRE